MRIWWRCLSVVLLATCLPACFDIDLGFPKPCGADGCEGSPPTASCDQIDEFRWLIRGFEFTDLATPCTGSECIVQLRVGDTRQLAIESVHGSRIDCTSAIVSAKWATTTAGVAAFEQAAPARALLRATDPGETSILADLQFTAGRQKQAQPYVSAIRIVSVRVLSR